jgi:hypothetical protein
MNNRNFLVAALLLQILGRLSTGCSSSGAPGSKSRLPLDASTSDGRAASGDSGNPLGGRDASSVSANAGSAVGSPNTNGPGAADAGRLPHDASPESTADAGRDAGALVKHDASTPALEACSAKAPAIGAHCSMTGDQACLLGGYSCLCQCQCVGGPPQCYEPCAWTCSFNDYAQLIRADQVNVVLDCSKGLPNPTFHVTANVTLHAPEGGPALTIQSSYASIDLAKPGLNGEFCSLSDAVGTPASVGPIAPGSSSTMVTEQRSGVCNMGVGAMDVCSYCGGTARVNLGVDVFGADIPGSSGNEWPLGGDPQGTPFPIQCLNL